MSKVTLGVTLGDGSSGSQTAGKSQRRLVQSDGEGWMTSRVSSTCSEAVIDGAARPDVARLSKLRGMPGTHARRPLG